MKICAARTRVTLGPLQIPPSMTVSKDSPPTPPDTCKNEACLKPLFGGVVYCPFCGTKHHSADAVVAAPAPAPKRHTVTVSAADQAEIPHAQPSPLAQAGAALSGGPQGGLSPAETRPPAPVAPSPIRRDEALKALPKKKPPPVKPAGPIATHDKPATSKVRLWLLGVAAASVLAYVALPSLLGTSAADKARKSAAETIVRASSSLAAPPPKTMPSAATLSPGSTSADNTTAIAQMLSLAMNGNWSRLDAQVQALKAALVVQPGDRKSSRQANTEGLKLLRAGNPAAAALALRRAWLADPSDVEAINNLAFAQMQAGQLLDALTTLERAISMAPDRTNAWANFAETLALGGNEPGAQAALRIALRFSTDRQRSIEALSKVRDTHPNATYVRVIRSVLDDINSIPRNPNDRTAAEPAQAPAQPSVPVPTVAQTSVGDARRIECEVLVRSGQRALANRSFDVAVQQASDALAAYPGCPGAQELSADARQARDVARAGVAIR